MSKTEFFLLLIILLILGSSLWFIFSDEIWVLVSYLETSLYPTLITPK
ncbi:TPA: Ecr family regulatory small membrane protein [Klebsiella aerogenes]|nr:Ecr family regulatory small membrane protein [Klebsiella aerogenes]HDU3701609.1 Ecr family regulatory small membrane protein [Klebsiella aerogenes]HDU3713340.1 Ecr family regulatory small membrane protein [Klebsiella aerogenes]